MFFAGFATAYFFQKSRTLAIMPPEHATSRRMSRASSQASVASNFDSQLVYWERLQFEVPSH